MGAAAAPYANELIFLFMGGFFIAAAMERTGLHRRIALGIVSRVGTSPNRLVLGFMLATAFLSMWISNTATAAMMLPWRWRCPRCSSTRPDRRAVLFRHQPDDRHRLCLFHRRDRDPDRDPAERYHGRGDPGIRRGANRVRPVDAGWRAGRRPAPARRLAAADPGAVSPGVLSGNVEAIVAEERAGLAR